MEIENRKEFRVDDTIVKLQIITGLNGDDDEKEHFGVMLQDQVCHVAVNFDNKEDAEACFATFLKMKNLGE